MAALRTIGPLKTARHRGISRIWLGLPVRAWIDRVRVPSLLLRAGEGAVHRLMQSSILAAARQSDPADIRVVASLLPKQQIERRGRRECH
jgi:hypothetical protein